MNDQRNLSEIYRVSELLYKSASQKLTDKESEELNEWANANSSNRELFDEIRSEKDLRENLNSLYNTGTEEALRSVQEKIFPAKRKLFFLAMKKWQYAAIVSAIVVAAGIGIYIKYDGPSGGTKIADSHPFHNDVAPGGNKALLTLEDGRTIILDTVQNGTLSRQGGTKVLKINNGQLAYKANASSTPGSVSYNMLSTPRGGQYQLFLPDGSKVWLNASSSLKYPTAFTGKDRGVELTGEGYFEVAKNAAMPFSVKVNGVAIEVLGTDFNVNAYADEAEVRTSLLTGSVRVSLGSVNSLLKPGDQSQVDAHGKFIVVNDVDVDNEISWKNGYFFFEKADIRTIMRQISRWYDVEVEFEGAVSETRRFGGKIQRDLQLSQVLEVLQTSQVHCRIEGRKLIVMP